MKENGQEIDEKTLLVNEVLADNSPEGQHEKQLSRYAAAKQRQELVSDFILQEINASGTQRLHKELVALLECGSFLLYRHYYTIGEFKLTAGCTCKKHLLCALCAIRRAAKCIALYTQKINLVREGQDFEEVLITFTVKHSAEDSLEKSFDFLLDSMKKIIQKRRDSLKKNARTYTEMKHLVGGAYAYEVTFSAKNGYHPHCHMIALVPKGTFTFTEMTLKNKKALVPTVLRNGIIEDWLNITNGSNIIDVRKIENTDMIEPGQDIAGSRIEALVEVFKYALKLNQMDKSSDSDSQQNIRLQVEAYEVLKSRHLMGSFGNLHGVKIPTNLNDQPLDASELPYIDLVYQYSGMFGYQLTTHGEVDTTNVSPRKLNDDQYLSHVLRQSEQIIKPVKSKTKPVLSRKLDLKRMVEDYVKKEELL